MLFIVHRLQIIMTSESQQIHEAVQTYMPLLRRLLSVTMYNDQMKVVAAILEKFVE